MATDLTVGRLEGALETYSAVLLVLFCRAPFDFKTMSRRSHFCGDVSREITIICARASVILVFAAVLLVLVLTVGRLEGALGAYSAVLFVLFCRAPSLLGPIYAVRLVLFCRAPFDFKTMSRRSHFCEDVSREISIM